MRTTILLTMMLLLTACNSFTKVNNEKTTVDGITLYPKGLWNAAPAIFTFKNIPTWTVDGPILNSIMFIAKIEDGQTLVKVQKDENYPSFDASMLPNEIMSLTQSTIAKMYGTTIDDDGELAPVELIDGIAFQFSFTFADQDGLTRKVLATAAVRDNKLYLMIYQAAKDYYFDKDAGNVEKMMKSMSISS